MEASEQGKRNYVSNIDVLLQLKQCRPFSINEARHRPTTFLPPLDRCGLFRVGEVKP